MCTRKGKRKQQISLKLFQGQSFAKMNFSLMTIFSGQGDGLEGRAQVSWTIKSAAPPPSFKFFGLPKVKAPVSLCVVKAIYVVASPSARCKVRFVQSCAQAHLFFGFFWNLPKNVGQKGGYHLVAIFGHILAFSKLHFPIIIEGSFGRSICGEGHRPACHIWIWNEVWVGSLFFALYLALRSFSRCLSSCGGGALILTFLTQISTLWSFEISAHGNSE